MSLCNQTDHMRDVSGVLPGDIGLFSECPINAEVKFCALFSSIALSKPSVLGLCIPSTCSSGDIARYTASNALLNKTFAYRNGVDVADYIFCSNQGSSLIDEQQQMSSHDLAMVIILGTWIVLLCLATFYDYIKGVTTSSGPWQRVRRNSDGNIVHVVQAPTVVDRRSWRASISGVSAATAAVGTHGLNPRRSRSSVKRKWAGRATHTQRVAPQADVEDRTVVFDVTVKTPLQRSSPAYGAVGPAERLLPTSESRDEIKDEMDADVQECYAPPRSVGFVTDERSGSPHAEEIDGDEVHRVSDDDDGPMTRTLTDRLENWIGEERLEALRERREALYQFVQDTISEFPDFPNLPDFQSILIRTVLCLSLINAFRKWRYFPETEANINVFNSIRVLAWLWIVLVDTFEYSLNIPTYTTTISEDTNPLYAFVQRQGSASYAISTFLIISGFNTMHRLISSENRPMSAAAIVMANSRTSAQRVCEYIVWYVKYFLSRLIRVVPLYAASLFLLQPLLVRAGKGPFWSTFTASRSLNTNCHENWWSNMLLVNNFLPHDVRGRCFPWSFYIALDFQLVVAAPLFHFLYKQVGYRVFALLALLMSLGSLSVRYVLAPDCSTTAEAPSRYAYSLGPTFEQPHYMLVPFLAGVSLYYAYRAVSQREANITLLGSEAAMLLLQHESKSKAVDAADHASFWLLLRLRSKSFRIGSIWTGIALMIGCIVGSWLLHRHEQCNDSAAANVFNAVSIFVWCLGVCLMVLPMLFGFGGNVRLFLIHRLWCGVSRLVFAAYLLHPLVISFCNANKFFPTSMEFLLFLVDSWGNVGVSLIVAFLFHLGVEQPSMYLGS